MYELCNGLMNNPALWKNTARILRRVPILMTLGHIGMRFIQPRFSVGVVSVVTNDAGQILLVEHVFHPTCPWGLPGGWINGGENPADCARREIREELALEVEIERVLLVEATFARHLDFAFLCRARGEIGQLSFELLNYGWYDPQNTPPLVKFHRNAVNAFLQLMDAKTYDNPNP